jgi:hypothetical protein
MSKGNIKMIFDSLEGILGKLIEIKTFLQKMRTCMDYTLYMSIAYNSKLVFVIPKRLFAVVKSAAKTPHIIKTDIIELASEISCFDNNCIL